MVFSWPAMMSPEPSVTMAQFRQCRQFCEVIMDVLLGYGVGYNFLSIG